MENAQFIEILKKIQEKSKTYNDIAFTAYIDGIIDVMEENHNDTYNEMVKRYLA